MPSPVHADPEAPSRTARSDTPLALRVATAAAPLGLATDSEPPVRVALSSSGVALPPGLMAAAIWGRRSWVNPFGVTICLLAHASGAWAVGIPGAVVGGKPVVEVIRPGVRARRLSSGSSAPPETQRRGKRPTAKVAQARLGMPLARRSTPGMQQGRPACRTHGRPCTEMVTAI
jgi:hypothetical protein